MIDKIVTYSTILVNLIVIFSMLFGKLESNVHLLSFVIMLLFIDIIFRCFIILTQNSSNDLIRGPYSSVLANEEELLWMASIEATTFSYHDCVPLPTLQSWFAKNSNGFLILRDRNGHYAGYMIILPLKDEIMKNINSGLYYDTDITAEDIYEPNERESITSLYISAFVTVSSDKFKTPHSISNILAAHVLLTMAPSLIDNLCDSKTVSYCSAIGASKSGKQLLTNLGFNDNGCKGHIDKYPRYTAEMKTLLHNIEQYKH